MTYQQLEQICIGLYGNTWQAQLELAMCLKKGRITQSWRRQGVPKGIKEKLQEIVDKRLIEVNKAVEVYYEI